LSLQPEAVRVPATRSEWYRSLANYEKPDARKATWQLVNTFVPYVGLWALMAVMLRQGLPYWTILPPAVLAAGFLTRIFIFFHDCGHGSFFASRQANRMVGYICGILTLTPFDEWRHLHAIHHASAGDLERRGVGDVWTLTVEEYLASDKWRRLGYRLFRHPFVLFLLGPLFLFFIRQRIPHSDSGKRERRSVHMTNLGIVALAVVGSLVVGVWTYLTVHVTVMGIAGVFGVWLFYVQHQYEEVYWDHHETWDPVKAALAGSSYYKLPKVLQWFSGNIGLHHIHHLKARIPNYNLQKCYDEVPEMRAVEPLTLAVSLKSLWFHLWDEQNRRMISFRDLKREGRNLARNTA
jgi:acyl-lipid omega-6 desaturase (Delta-12 desaturase)